MKTVKHTMYAIAAVAILALPSLVDAAGYVEQARQQAGQWAAQGKSFLKGAQDYFGQGAYKTPEAPSGYFNTEAMRAEAAQAAEQARIATEEAARQAAAQAAETAQATAMSEAFSRPQAPADVWNAQENLALVPAKTTGWFQSWVVQPVQNWLSRQSMPSRPSWAPTWEGTKAKWQENVQPALESAKTKFQENVQPKLEELTQYASSKFGQAVQAAKEHPYVAGAIGAGATAGAIYGAYCVYKYKANKAAQQQCQNDLSDFERIQKNIRAGYAAENSPALGLVNKITTAINQPGALDEFKKQNPNITLPSLAAVKALQLFSTKAGLTPEESGLLSQLFSSTEPEIIIIKNSVLDNISRALGYGGITKAQGQQREIGLGAAPKPQPTSAIPTAPAAPAIPSQGPVAPAEGLVAK